MASQVVSLKTEPGIRDSNLTSRTNLLFNTNIIRY